ncbi:MAG: hypothetical protein LBK44_03585 [Spirochaetales bacterium]|nr:hypothetical protein [Spirochaetales bacterium]
MQILWAFRYNPLRPTGFPGFGTGSLYKPAMNLEPLMGLESLMNLQGMCRAARMDGRRGGLGGGAGL